METKLIIETYDELSMKQMEELFEIVKIQTTSDRSEAGYYSHDGEHGQYFYRIDQDNFVHLISVK